MKTDLISWFLLAGLVCGCAGQKTSEFKEVENGFGYFTHVSGVIDPSITAGLCYRDANGNISAVWPHLQIVWGNNIVITNNTAVLIGGRAEVYKDGRERLSDRLIAFKAPKGPPVDITEPLLQIWASQNSLSITNYIKDSFVSITETNDAIQIVFISVRYGERGPGTINAHGTTFVIPWRRVETVIQDVMKNGKPKKEEQSGFEYLEKD